MTTRLIRYLIEPARACPAALLDRRGRPGKTCTLNIGDVGLTAMREVLHTSPGGNSFFGLLEELLVPGERRLIWREDGPGRGLEMRRAFSGLFGRFFARAYLERYHDFTWFVPINRDPTYVSAQVRVTKASPARVDLPDWICAGQGNSLAIAEAKVLTKKAIQPAARCPDPSEPQTLSSAGLGCKSAERETAAAIDGSTVL